MYNFDSVLIKKQNPREDLAVFSNRRIAEAFSFLFTPNISALDLKDY